jgi:hypothetical protein
LVRDALAWAAQRELAFADICFEAFNKHSPQVTNVTTQCEIAYWQARVEEARAALDPTSPVYTFRLMTSIEMYKLAMHSPSAVIGSIERLVGIHIKLLTVDPTNATLHESISDCLVHLKRLDLDDQTIRPYAREAIDHWILCGRFYLKEANLISLTGARGEIGANLGVYEGALRCFKKAHACVTEGWGVLEGEISFQELDDTILLLEKNLADLEVSVSSMEETVSLYSEKAQRNSVKLTSELEAKGAVPPP